MARCVRVSILPSPLSRVTGGYDVDFTPFPATKRQQWLNYRDGTVYKHVVTRSPFFPINSLMLHGAHYNICNYTKLKMTLLGIIMSDLEHGSVMDKGVLEHHASLDFQCECWTYFAYGANLQELYIVPRLMKQHQCV